MEEFLVNISSFPTVIYTTALVVVVGYWLLSFTGTFDLDAFDIEIDLDVDTEVGQIGGVAGLLTTLGLTGVPITIVISLLVLNAWIVCYFGSMAVSSLAEFASLINVVVGVGVATVSFAVSILVSANMIKPLKGLFKKVNQAPKSKSLLGSICRIRSSRVDHEFGEAECQHDGASLIIKVRATGEQTFVTGETVVLIEHNPDQDFFNIVSEKEFKQQLN
ncbi:MAG: DUF1449 family protein [Gammaproteobacteria bacterium]|nr:DUF1449 family protein [Gammaproteobacteria bacterium]